MLSCFSIIDLGVIRREVRAVLLTVTSTASHVLKFLNFLLIAAILPPTL